MYAKLALRSLRRSVRNHVIYFVTVALTVALMDAFLTLSFSRDILALSENLSLLGSGLLGVSLLVSALASGVIAYAIRFMLDQRKGEFAMYQVLGMEARVVQRMFLLETALLALLAFGVGAVLGTALSGVLAQGVWYIFQSPHAYRLTVSPKALGLTFLLFCLLYALGALRAARVLGEGKLAKLLASRRANEGPPPRRPWVWGGVCLLSLGAAAGGCLLLGRGLTLQTNAAWGFFAGSAALLLGGVYSLHRALPPLFLAWARRRPGVKYRRETLFYLGQMGARLTTAGRVLAATALLFTLALAALFLGLSLGTGYRANMEAYYPYDVGVAVDAPLTKESSREILAFVEARESVTDSVAYHLYDTPCGTQALSLSAYNHLRGILGLSPARLGEGEYLVQCDSWNYVAEIRDRLSADPALTIGDRTLVPGPVPLYTDPMEQYQLAGLRGHALVLPDQVAETLPAPKFRLVLALEDGGEPQLREELRDFLKESWRPQLLPGHTLPQKVTLGVSVQAWGVANSLAGFTVLSFCGLYLSLVLLLLSGAILAFHQLAGLDRNRRSYGLLRQLGVSRRSRSRLAAGELATFFAIPWLLPVLVTLALALAAQRAFGAGVLLANAFLLAGLGAVGVFTAVYALYFAAACHLYRRAVL